MSDRFRSLSDLPTSLTHQVTIFRDFSANEEAQKTNLSSFSFIEPIPKVLDPVYTGELQNQKDVTVLRFGELEEELRKIES